MWLWNTLTDYPLKDVRNFAAKGGHSLLWPGATTFQSHMGAHSRPKAATVTCGRMPQGLLSQKSRLKSGHLNLTPLSKFRFVIYDYELTCYTRKKKKSFWRGNLREFLRIKHFVKIKYLWNLWYTYTFAKHLKTDQLVYYVFCVI